jgi:hypothetical protein
MVQDESNKRQRTGTPGVSGAGVSLPVFILTYFNCCSLVFFQLSDRYAFFGPPRFLTPSGPGNMMIAEFGVAPSSGPVTSEAYSDGRKPAGSVGSFANTLAAQGHGPGPEGVRNLGGPKNAYRYDNWKKTSLVTGPDEGATPNSAIIIFIHAIPLLLFIRSSCHSSRVRGFSDAILRSQLAQPDLRLAAAISAFV